MVPLARINKVNTKMSQEEVEMLPQDSIAEIGAAESKDAERKDAEKQKASDKEVAAEELDEGNGQKETPENENEAEEASIVLKDIAEPSSEEKQAERAVETDEIDVNQERESEKSAMTDFPCILCDFVEIGKMFYRFIWQENTAA
jgi:hypothetical protein